LIDTSAKEIAIKSVNGITNVLKDLIIKTKGPNQGVEPKFKNFLYLNLLQII